MFAQMIQRNLISAWFRCICVQEFVQEWTHFCFSISQENEIRDLGDLPS